MGAGNAHDVCVIASDEVGWHYRISVSYHLMQGLGLGEWTCVYRLVTSVITVVLLEFGIIMIGVGGEEGGKVCAYHVVLAVDGLVHRLLLAVACRFVNGPRN